MPCAQPFPGAEPSGCSKLWTSLYFVVGSRLLCNKDDAKSTHASEEFAAEPSTSSVSHILIDLFNDQ